MNNIKQILDFSFAFVLFVLTLPLLLLILLITWLELKCRVIFAELRTGKNNISFIMYKITSMKPTSKNIAARALGPIKKNDPRLTKFGRFIRRYSLDELPQFINVMKGEMSLVGPRPELPKTVEHWNSVLPEYPRRLTVNPGMSGWAQVNGYRKGYIEPEIRLAHDLYYIDNWSVGLDIKIILKTPKAILTQDVW